MELELALAESCDAGGCRVRVSGTGQLLDAAYGEKVRDRIRIRSGDLVAVDLAASPPAIVGRWWHGTVREVDDGGATIERAVTQRAAGDPSTGTLQATVPGALRGQIAVGDTVFLFGHGGAEGAMVIDVAGDSGLEHRSSSQAARASTWRLCTTATRRRSKRFLRSPM